LFYNTNKLIKPNRLAFATVIYRDAKECCGKGDSLRAMGMYYQGLVTCPLEAKMLSNLVITLYKNNYGNRAKQIYNFIITYLP